jgi:DNA invertase Pin-like site-specific DNA recombinase
LIYFDSFFKAPAGKAMFQIRVRAGLARARSEGTTLGRPKTPAAVEAAIRATLASGVGMLKTAKLHGVGCGTVQRIAASAATVV